MSTIRTATVDELRAEISRREAEDRETPPSPLVNPDWSALHELVRVGIGQQWSERFRDEKLRAYVYETAVEAVFGKGIFAKLNRRCP